MHPANDDGQIANGLVFQPVVVGQTIEDIETWPEEIRKVKLDDLKRVAAKYFDIKSSVTGYLRPQAAVEAKAKATGDRS